MIETIEYAGKQYPKFQSEGFSSKFSFPFAECVCKGIGYDIGCGKIEWAFPGSHPIDKTISKYHDATFLPLGNIDYIFSSHCLEHIPDWMKVLDYWITKIKKGGVLFLYLPDSSQSYWSYGNPKHVNIFTPEIIRGFMENRKLDNIFVSGCDLNHSFCAMGEISGS